MWGMEKGKNALEKAVLELFLETDLKKTEHDFMALKETFERVDMVYNHIKEASQFKRAISEPQFRKSNQESEKARTEGNNYFKRDRNYQGALECYTRSIALAENGSSYLALAYGNRSAILFERKYYKECMEDIERALSLEYPENLKQKLVIRMGKAESLKSRSKEIKYYKDTPIINSKNPNISSASDSVKIHYTENYGRHIIATKNIKIGEVISVEDTFTHIVHPESKYVHCHQCLEICYNMIPCKNCSTALYCSEECRSLGFEKYHKYECQFPKVLLSPEMVFIQLALIGLEDSKRLNNDPPEIYRSDSFKEIIKLAMNEEKRNFANLCIPAIAASLAYQALKEIPEFSSIYDSDEDNQNLKEFLYKAYMINAFNPFNIKKMSHDQFDVKHTRVATALYAFTSLYNHSCVPNCEFFHYGSQIVTRAQDNIKEGEQVTICYGISFSTTPKPVRQAVLKKNYVFDCDCRACTLDWPTYDELRLGKELPLQFQMKTAQNDFSDTESNNRLLEKLLSTAKLLFNDSKKQEPCQNLLKLQNIINEIYTYQANRDVTF